MKLSFFSYVTIWGMTAVEAGLSLLLLYRFLFPMRIYFGVLAVLDVEFAFVAHRADFHLIFWYTQIFLLIFQAYIAARLSRLLIPRLIPAVEAVFPAIIIAATLMAGKPGTVWFGELRTTHMIMFCVGCLTFITLLLIFAIVCSAEKRFEEISLGFGLLMAAQSIAFLGRMYMGFNPLFFNLCWLAGIACIVHALFTYEPPTNDLPVSVQLQRARIAKL